ncbi:MAG: large conductance mechanosensitive channel protein MscL [Chloroflexi bacterium]|nr:large conductance mechanosensitive channel protein MscL [Chloroflexota bacterium]
MGGGHEVIAEFKAFLLKTNALALAIGVIIGGAFGTVVSSLVNDIIMPPIGKVLGNVDFSNLVIDLGDDVFIRWGAFINSVIAFVVIAFVVWRISKMFIREEEAPAPPEQKTCPYCRQLNAIDATKCMHCASSI